MKGAVTKCRLSFRSIVIIMNESLLIQTTVKCPFHSTVPDCGIHQWVMWSYDGLQRQGRRRLVIIHDAVLLIAWCDYKSNVLSSL